MRLRFAALPGWVRFIVFCAVGGIAGLGQAPIDLWPATILALAFMLFMHPTSRSPRQSAFHVWSFGLGYFAFTLRWIVEPFLIDAGRYGWMAPFALALMAAGAALFWAGFAYAADRALPRSTLALGLALCWAELTRSLVFTGFPWALLGHIWVPTPWAQLAAYGGPHLLTLVTVMTAWAVMALISGTRMMGGAILIAILLLAPLLRPAAAVDNSGPIVRLVQPNAPQDQKWDPDHSAFFLNRLVALTGQGAVPDLVVWPETSVPYLLNYVQSDLSLLSDAARGAPLVFGIQRRDDAFRYYNSLVVMGQGGIIQSVYDKRHLVPFGEYVPFGDMLSRWGVHGLATTDGAGFAGGQSAGPVQLPGIGGAVPLICYEGIFAEEIDSGDGERPRLLLLITNDAWFGEAAGPYQHLAQARLRAIEQGLPMVRVANTGISAMIDPQGRIVAALALNTSGTLDVALPAARPVTFYARMGEWPHAVLLILLTTMGYLALRRRSD